MSAALLLTARIAHAGTPFGEDESGFLPPPGSTAFNCEKTFAAASRRAITCIMKCHDARAVGKTADASAEDSCEGGCSLKWQAAVGGAYNRFKHCPPCNIRLFFLEANSSVNANNGLIYCASPSGAFVDEGILY